MLDFAEEIVYDLTAKTKKRGRTGLYAAFRVMQPSPRSAS